MSLIAIYPTAKHIAIKPVPVDVTILKVLREVKRNTPYVVRYIACIAFWEAGYKLNFNNKDWMFQMSDKKSTPRIHSDKQEIDNHFQHKLHFSQ